MAKHSHKRDTDARRTPRAAVVAAPLAVLATASAVTLGVLGADVTGAASSVTAARDTSAPTVGQPSIAVDISGHRRAALSRGGDRGDRQRTAKAEEKKPSKVDRMLAPERVRNVIRKADTKQWTTTVLNLWSEPGEEAEQTGEIDEGERVLVTGREMYGRQEIVQGKETRWVTSGYLSDDKPVGPAAGLSDAPCPDGGVESGLTSDAVTVYRAVCNAFPQITTYGGYDGHGEHASGKAIDIMTSDVELGTAIADFLQAHASELNLYDIIWRQHIWTPVRASEGWRSMPSRGSATADHYDHVHVSVN